jgi:hypothetical protein
VSEERLASTAYGNARYPLETPRRDGTTLAIIARRETPRSPSVRSTGRDLMAC